MKATKTTVYFSHDQDARGDEKIVKLLRDHGPLGYGVYWLIVEKLYGGEGSIEADLELLAFDLRVEQSLIASVTSKFGLFYRKGGRLRSRSVDRRLALRQGLIENARAAGKASAAARAERMSNGRSTGVQLESKKESNKHKTAANAPSAADNLRELKTASESFGRLPGRNGDDLLELQLPFAFGDIPRGRRIADIPASCAQAILDKGNRLGFEIERALRHRVKVKAEESAR